MIFYTLLKKPNLTMRIALLAMVLLVNCSSEDASKDKKIRELEAQVSELEEKVSELESSQEKVYVESSSGTTPLSVFPAQVATKKYVYATTIYTITQEFPVKKRLLEDDPSTTYSTTEKVVSNHPVVTDILELSNYTEDMQYRARDAIKAAIESHIRLSANLLQTSSEIGSIELHDFDTYAAASVSRENTGIRKQVKVYFH